MSNQFRLHSSGPSSNRPRQSRARLFAAWTTAVYGVVILALALIVGTRLHDWARQRIVHMSVLTEIAEQDTPAPVAEAPADVAGPVEPAQQTAQAIEAAAPVEVAAVAEPMNILLLGTDERPDEYGPSRTDTMILLSVNPETGAMGMVSLPRDLWVPIPGLGITTKINTAYQLGELQDYPGGGAQLAKDTVSSFVGRPVDYFVRVNFDGFRQLIDLIGGVTIDVPYTIHDEEYPTQDYGVETFHLDAGLQLLDGETALKYARTRHGDDDYNRARRQQDIIRAVAQKVMSAGMIPQLLGKAPQLLMTMQNSIETDLPVPVGIELAKNLQEGGTGEMGRLVLDNRYGEETFSSEGAWILLPDRSKVRVALESFYAPLVAPRGAQAIAMADPAAVRIEVLNGTSQPGAAARTAELLKEQGWQVTSIGDADRNDYAQTIVINYGVADNLIKQVSTDLSLTPEQSQLRGLAAATPVDIRIVIGNDILPVIR
ncbi:MAG: LCP family protein [Caldilinea sp.]|nr:LCP family protein [Caldilinea sp.]